MGTRSKVMAVVAASLAVLGANAALAGSTPQRLPSAILIWPLVVVDGGGAVTDTRIELVNLSKQPVNMGCIFVPASTCSGLDFLIQLTPNQPISWLASRGMFNGLTAVPPFFGSGELKCIVEPDDEFVSSYNAIQGRAAVFGADGQTVGYSAFGFLRLTDGPLTSKLDLDGVTYTQCPDEQHFSFLASDGSTPINPAAESELVLTPCSEDLENHIIPSVVVQFRIINEFEEQFSASTSMQCSARKLLRQISNVFTRAILGSDTGQLVVRGVQTPILAMVIDRFLTPPAPATAGNEPALRGGRSAQIVVPFH